MAGEVLNVNELTIIKIGASRKICLSKPPQTICLPLDTMEVCVSWSSNPE
jgi:hypothetical protein